MYQRPTAKALIKYVKSKLVVLVYFIFKKQLICQWWERKFLYGFVALSVRMCVAEANEIEVTMS